MKVAIVGYGREGKASAEYWRAQGGDVTVCDIDSDHRLEGTIPEVFKHRLGADSYLRDLHEFDVIVRTAGMHPSVILDANAEHPEIINRITTNLNEFLRVCPSRNLIGVTGTKGKGTTSTIATKILQASGKAVHLVGNIGVAALGLLPEVTAEDVVVIEFSSFQLFDIKKSVPTAVCLTVSPEHLNWHSDVEDYMNAKANLFRLQTKEDRAIYNSRSGTSTDIVSKSPGHKTAYEVPPVGQEASKNDGAYVQNETIYYRETTIIEVDQVAIPGRHNLENICAAITAVWPLIDGDLDAIRQVLTTFTGLEEHLELIREVNGVKYYNDTYATAPDAAIAAMNAFQEAKVMILGGIDKQVPLEGLVDAVIASNVRGVVLIDDLADQLAGLFSDRHYKNAILGGPHMSGIVEKAHAFTRPGDVVLLSPGCAGNGGMFVDKLDRGHQFNTAVGAL